MMRNERVLLVAAALVLASCGAASSSRTALGPTPSTLPALVELKYDLIAQFGPPGYCDPDAYPVARQLTDADVQQRVAAIAESEPGTYRAIIAHHGFTGTLSAAQARIVYQDYKVLRTVATTWVGGRYTFTYVARGASAMTGTRYQGAITSSGMITIESQSPTRIMCPICLAKGTLIATPDGQIPVENVRLGMLVFSADAEGRRVLEPVLEVGSTVAPPWHQVEQVSLDDGRVLTASPGHPTADGRHLEELTVGDSLDGGRVVALQLVDYGSGRTYDLLPAGPTGDYWADGVLIGSTLRPTLVR